jgi:DNA-binding transcriptional ArsR family regulator
VSWHKALADDNRQQIISLLIEMTSLNVTQITERLEIFRPAISHHLKILRQANLVDYVRKGKERFYCLSPKINDSLKILRNLIEALEAQQ